MTVLNSKIPAGPLTEKWSKHKAAIKVVSPANKRKLDIIVVGTGLAGGSAAASLAEMGYNVKAFCYQDSGRSVVAYFLANAGTWRGEVARRVKKELNAMIK